MTVALGGSGRHGSFQGEGGEESIRVSRKKKKNHYYDCRKEAIILFVDKSCARIRAVAISIA
jgi:hypothetical protein